MDNQGRVCGHVLAWSDSKAIAYICPMEIMLEDIKKTLKARSITLPGSEEDVIVSMNAVQQGTGPFNDEMELPDIARLDFGDRERLGLGEGMLRSRISPMRLRARKEYPGFIGTPTRQIA